MHYCTESIVLKVFLSKVLHLKNCSERIVLKELIELGSGCGTVGRADASDTRDPRFKSHHRQIIYRFICQLHDIEKTKIKKKRQG